MLVCIWEELEFQLGVLCMVQGAYIQLYCLYKNFMYLSIKNILHFSWQYVIFNWTVRLGKDFWPVLNISLLFVGQYSSDGEILNVSAII